MVQGYSPPGVSLTVNAVRLPLSRSPVERLAHERLPVPTERLVHEVSYGPAMCKVRQLPRIDWTMHTARQHPAANPETHQLLHCCPFVLQPHRLMNSNPIEPEILRLLYCCPLDPETHQLKYVCHLESGSHLL